MNTLQRTLSGKSTIAIVIGGIIGSGIFMKPAQIAGFLGNPILCISVWVVAGIFTLFGALSNAEVAAMFPETGGQYIFFEKMYGKTFSFMYGWASFAVFNTAGNASIAYVCSQYIGYFVHLPTLSTHLENTIHFHILFIGDIYPLKEIGLKLLTVFIIILLSCINYRSVSYSSGLQRVLTALKSIAIVLLIGGVLLSHKGHSANLHCTPVTMGNWELITAYMSAIAAAFWAYDGWNNITFIAGEIKDPQRNIPRSLFLGLLFCIIVYVAINIAYSYILPIQTIANSTAVAADTANIVWGSIGAVVIALMVILSTFGTTNANILATARVTYAMGHENKLFAKAGITQPKFNTPGNAIIFNAAWSIVLIFSGSFDMLTEMLIFVSWFYYGMSALGVFILRYKLKEVHRPYKVWGYPFVPFLFILFTAFFLTTTLITDINNYYSGKSTLINSLLGIVIALIGLPVYYLQKKSVEK